MTTSLTKRIQRMIEMSGPMSVAEYMHVCMTDAKDGYYTNSTPFGHAGDFITAPEISQMFGELIGIWAIKAWEVLGMPNEFSLVELGPGNGTMMADILRATRVMPQFMNAAQINLVEASPKLIKEQDNRLGAITAIQWHESIDTLPNQPTILIANEFLDALPVHQYVKSEGKWFERCIGLNKNGQLDWVLGTGVLDTSQLPQDHNQEPDGAVYEISPAREAVISGIAGRINQHPSVALFIDYGHIESGYGDTFQAVSRHKYSNPLEAPGQADLTSHVDFAALVRIANQSGVTVLPIMTQGEFLLKIGLLERAGNLGQNQSEEIQARLKSEAERLALPDTMGNLFKVLCITRTDIPLWPFDGGNI